MRASGAIFLGEALLVLALSGGASSPASGGPNLSPGATGHRLSVPIWDRSALGSPLAISGTVSVKQALGRGRLRWSFSDSGSMVNVSPKPILTVVVKLGVAGSCGAGFSSTMATECLFWPGTFLPGEKRMLDDSHGPATTMDVPCPGPAVGEPHAEARVVFVQFLDGTVFGSDAFAREILLDRREVLQHLRLLYRVYLRDGPSSFLDELRQPVDPPIVNEFFVSIRQTQQSDGTQAAFEEVKLALTTAEERLAAFHRSPPPADPRGR